MRGVKMQVLEPYNLYSHLYSQEIAAGVKKSIEQQSKQTKTYRIIQTLLMISGVVLVCLGGFGVFGAGIFAGLAIGLGSFFVTSVFANIFVGLSGYGAGVVNTNAANLHYEVLSVNNSVRTRNFGLSIAMALMGIALITCGAFGVIELGMACSIGIPIFFAALGGIVLNSSKLQRKIISSMSRLRDFYIEFLHNRDENIVLLGSIVTCLTLGIMTLLGSLNLMFAIGLMIPLLVGSGIFKIVMFFKQRHEQKLFNERLESLANDTVETYLNQNLNLGKNKDNQENNQIPPQTGANKKNEEEDLNNPPGPTP